MKTRDYIAKNLRHLTYAATIVATMASGCGTLVTKYDLTSDKNQKALQKQIVEPYCVMPIVKPITSTLDVVIGSN